MVDLGSSGNHALLVQTGKAHPKVAEKEGMDADRHGGPLGHEPGDTLSDIERGKREVGTHNAPDHRQGAGHYDGEFGQGAIAFRGNLRGRTCGARRVEGTLFQRHNRRMQLPKSGHLR